MCDTYFKGFLVKNQHVPIFNKKTKADLVRNKNKLVSPIKKKVGKLEVSIIKSEETLASHQKKLLEARAKKRVRHDIGRF